MSALICGSMAFDTIMVFQDRFKNHILPEQVHILNVSFLVPEMRRNFGGCAGNIAFNLHMLEGNGLPMGAVGSDFGPYADWMDVHKIPRSALRKIPRAFTAQAYITTDQDDNQITAFHPGAMSFAHECRVSDVAGVEIGMVSPDGRQGMIGDKRGQGTDNNKKYQGDPFYIGYSQFFKHRQTNAFVHAGLNKGHRKHETAITVKYNGDTKRRLSAG